MIEIAKCTDTWNTNRTGDQAVQAQRAGAILCARRKGTDIALARKLEDRLNNLDKAKAPEDIALPGYRLHQLAGDRRGRWSVRVSGNWRVVFKFSDGDAVDVDLVDYH